LYNFTILINLTKRTTLIAFELVLDALLAVANYAADDAAVDPLKNIK
jgi:hypothetical protein